MPGSGCPRARTYNSDHPASSSSDAWSRVRQGSTEIYPGSSTLRQSILSTNIGYVGEDRSLDQPRMEFLAALYPPLSQRQPLPSIYIPTGFVLIVLPHLFPKSSKSLGVLLTFPLLLLLILGLPYFDCGSPQDDYHAAPPTFQFLSFYLETVIFPPSDGLRFVGVKQGDKNVSVEDCQSLWSKLKWALRLQTTSRGIGWNWQVKNVPKSDDGHLSRWRFVFRRLQVTLWYFALKVLSLYLLGVMFTVKESGLVQSRVQELLIRTATGWLTAAWIYQDLQLKYHCCAVGSVALGMFEPWEWPPMFGSFKDAWSVRQMWSVSWHQVIRRMNQQPSIRIARFFGLRKGTLASKYFQLYMGFLISALLHEWSVFNATRKDGGEMWFFMIQAVAIMVEDFVQWVWRKCTGAREWREPSLAEKVFGWTWTLLWFSYTLPVLANSLIECGLLDVDAPRWAMVLGRQHAIDLLR